VYESVCVRVCVRESVCVYACKRVCVSLSVCLSVNVCVSTLFTGTYVYLINTVTLIADYVSTYVPAPWECVECL
jgi:hypothetical protein